MNAFEYFEKDGQENGNACHGNNGSINMDTSTGGRNGDDMGTENKDKKDINFDFNIDVNGKRGRGTDNKNVIWGALFLIGAIALMVNKLGFLNILLGGMSFFQIIATVFLVGVLVKGMAKHSFGQILFSVAFIIIVNDKVLHMEAFTPWTVLGAALLGTIGLHLMFPKVRSGYGRFLSINGKEIFPGRINEESREGDSARYENSFGESVKYVSGEISRVKLDNAFGSMQVYFTDAKLVGGTAGVIVDNVFGSTIIYIPAGWKVVMNVESAFGGVSQKGQCSPAGDNVLYMKGDTCFGTIQVRYI